MQKGLEDAYYAPLEEGVVLKCLETPAKVMYHMESKEGSLLNMDFSNEKLDPSVRLQSYYTKAFEYRMFNAFEAERNRRYASYYSTLIMCLSAASSLLLLLGTNSSLLRIGAILGAAISLLAGISAQEGYEAKSERHTMCVAAFANVQRDLANILETLSIEEMALEFDDAVARFNDARNLMPLVDPERVNTYFYIPGKGILGDNETVSHEDKIKMRNHLMFKHINEHALWNESIMNIEAIASLKAHGIFPDALQFDKPVIFKPSTPTSTKHAQKVHDLNAKEQKQRKIEQENVSEKRLAMNVWLKKEILDKDR